LKTITVYKYLTPYRLVSRITVWTASEVQSLNSLKGVMLRLLQHQVGKSPQLCAVSLRVARAFATETESAIQEKLQKALTVKDVNVRDTSGGCGTMFEIKVAADEFKNKSIVQQHKVVTKILQDEISQWHGFVLLTSAPNNS